jgi:hypothetical protein
MAARSAQREHFLEELLLPPVDTPPEQLVQYCMAALRDNDKPCPDAGKLFLGAWGRHGSDHPQRRP